jgi:flavin reductase (DIM6/NTAB) family NADH-FMN oxidoreductase RutF
MRTSLDQNSDARSFQDAFWRACTHLPSSVAVVAALDADDKPFGFTVSSLTAVSTRPPMVSICVDQESKRIAQLREQRQFCINVLARTQADLAQRFATPGVERFAEIPWREGSFGAPVIPDTMGAFFCEFKNAIAAGDHQLVVAEVLDLQLNGGEPLIYWRRAFHHLLIGYPFVESEAALEGFVVAWQQGTLPKRAWTHGAHVAAAAYFAFDHSPAQTLEIMSKGIVHFNTCVGTLNTEDSGYHETLTRFWAGVVGEFVRAGQFASKWEAARSAVQVFGEDRDRHRLYYSFDVVRDRAARKAWIPPDRKPLSIWLGDSGVTQQHCVTLPTILHGDPF